MDTVIYCIPPLHFFPIEYFAPRPCHATLCLACLLMECLLLFDSSRGFASRTGKLDEAEPLYRKAVEIGDAVLGPQHPDLATWLNNLATLVRDRGDPDAAEPLQRRAVSIGERVLGPSHPDLGAQVINLASLLSMQGEILEVIRKLEA